MTARLLIGDCRRAMRSMARRGILVDAIVTDPPYHLTSIVKRFGANGSAAVKPGRTGAYKRASAGFMGQKWDGGDVAFDPETWKLALRVLKPGGHLLAFGGTRGWHRMARAIEDAGFEIRDNILDMIAADDPARLFMSSLTEPQADAFLRCIEDSQFGGMLAWVYGSGFPKSHDVSKGIDKSDAVGFRGDRALRFTGWMRSTGISARRINELTGSSMGSHYLTDKEQPEVATAEMFDRLRRYLPAVPGWVEDLITAREVESENLKRRQVIETRRDEGNRAVRILQGNTDYDITAPHTPEAAAWQGWGTALKPAFEPIVLARKPLSEKSVAANVLAHGTGAINVDGCRIDAEKPTGWGGKAAGGDTWNDQNCGLAKGGDARPVEGRWPANVAHDGGAEVEAAFAAFGEGASGAMKHSVAGYDGEGVTGFLRGESGPHNQRADSGTASRFFYSAKAGPDDRFGSKHPTVKPVTLMRWLVRMVCPPGGTVLDPFAGSGSTGIAALAEGMSAILCEADAGYAADIRARLDHYRGSGGHSAGVKARHKDPVHAGPLFGEAPS